jgi:hypothetical protein
MFTRIACWAFYWFLALAAVWLLAGGKELAAATFLVGTFIYLGFMGVHLWSTRPLAQKRRAEHWEREHPDPALEAILLGPVSRWVTEGERRAVQDWEAKHPGPPPKADQWVTLYHIGQDAYHEVPDKPDVIAHFRERGWEPRDADLPWPVPWTARR